MPDDSLDKRSSLIPSDSPDVDRPPGSFAPSSTPIPGAAAGGAGGEPPTLSLMGRLFGVPLLIVGAMVGGALLVMVTFGEIAGDGRRSVDSLLASLESSSGEKVAGALFPRDRELWQDARELAMRLDDAERKLSPQELDQVVARLSGLLARDAQDSTRLSDMGRQRLKFFMTALSHTGSPQAVEALVARLGDPLPETRREALVALGRLHHVPQAREALPRIVPLLDDPDGVVRTVACWLMSLLARPEDDAVIAKLVKAGLAEDREVRWNAALSLARLGKMQAKSVLFDMLDRDYWEHKVPVRGTARDGGTLESPMPAGAVEQYLVAAVDAAAQLDDAELREAIAELAADPSPKVADRARSALSRTPPRE